MAVKQYGFPHQTRTDKGTETLLMAKCQMRFREAEEDRQLAVSDCHLFGTSVRNIRIESWWSRLVSAQTGPWREMFLSYAKTGNKWEKIAIQYLYMDLIRRDCTHFIKVHNTHHIQSQRK